MMPLVQKTSMFSQLRKGPLKVSIIGSGNWGTCIARIVAENVQQSYIFDNDVKIWVHADLTHEGEQLVKVMQRDRENKMYLPGYKLSDNLICLSDIVETVKDADLLVFVLPHQFVTAVCDSMVGHVKPTCRGISLVKGFHVEHGRPVLFTNIIENILGIDMAMMSGANVANDIARGEFSETTIGYKGADMAAIWQQLFDRPYFKVNCVPDVDGVQICGAVKNIIALSAGFCEGLGLGTNTKSAIIRIGVEEMKMFGLLFFEGILEETFFDSCGFADVVTTCFGGRNVRCAAEFTRRGGRKSTSWEEIEGDLLGGMKMQGHLTCEEVYSVLKHNGLCDYFPLFTATYAVAFGDLDATEFLTAFKTSETRPAKNADECHEGVIPPALRDLKLSLQRSERSYTNGSL
ncbi:MAG: uncharacterized protein KVP18_000777 [Porospora cf. gigantea A]|uniref:uncharacterized protein n=2 Tax=Porospora cf. gigantea A TaxID=2853593 RepID=UPI00355A75B9|nr:MAG: hypothetical protein KVP18_000777 [Porospora cf. gigantea A]